MSANRNTRATDNPFGHSGGLVWNRLHSEREEICEALLKESTQVFAAEAATQRTAKEDAMDAANWHKDLLQARLGKLDGALDRLMSGSYGKCCECGRWIEDTKLEFDPAVAFCVECWQREQARSKSDRSQGENADTPRPAIQHSDSSNEMDASPAGVVLQTLARFDTILVQTLNSDYRIFLLDPRIGRALVEGGPIFVEPVEAVIIGSTAAGSKPGGWVGIGFRIEMWVKDKLVSTSPVKSIRVAHYATPEPARVFISGVQ